MVDISSSDRGVFRICAGFGAILLAMCSGVRPCVIWCCLLGASWSRRGVYYTPQFLLL